MKTSLNNAATVLVLSACSVLAVETKIMPEMVEKMMQLSGLNFNNIESNPNVKILKSSKNNWKCYYKDGNNNIYISAENEDDCILYTICYGEVLKKRTERFIHNKNTGNKYSCELKDEYVKEWAKTIVDKLDFENREEYELCYVNHDDDGVWTYKLERKVKGYRYDDNWFAVYGLEDDGKIILETCVLRHTKDIKIEPEENYLSQEKSIELGLKYIEVFKNLAGVKGAFDKSHVKVNQILCKRQNERYPYNAKYPNRNTIVKHLYRYDLLRPSLEMIFNDKSDSNNTITVAIERKTGQLMRYYPIPDPYNVYGE